MCCLVSLQLGVEGSAYTKELYSQLCATDHPITQNTLSVARRTDAPLKHAKLVPFKDHVAECSAEVVKGQRLYMDNRCLSTLLCYSKTERSAAYDSLYAALVEANALQSVDSEMSRLLTQTLYGRDNFGVDVLCGQAGSYAWPHVDFFPAEAHIIVLEGRKTVIQMRADSEEQEDALRAKCKEYQVLTKRELGGLMEMCEKHGYNYEVMEVKAGYVGVIDGGSVHAAYNEEKTVSIQVSVVTFDRFPNIMTRFAQRLLVDGREFVPGIGILELMSMYEQYLQSLCARVRASLKSMHDGWVEGHRIVRAQARAASRAEDEQATGDMSSASGSMGVPGGGWATAVVDISAREARDISTSLRTVNSMVSEWVSVIMLLPPTWVARWQAQLRNEYLTRAVTIMGGSS
jgi:hypothetical protein